MHIFTTHFKLLFLHHFKIPILKLSYQTTRIFAIYDACFGFVYLLVMTHECD